MTDINMVARDQTENPQSAWQWWAGDSEEWFYIGPYASREEAIEEATDAATGEFQDEDDGGVWTVGIYVVEARQDPLRIADWIKAYDLLDVAEEEVSESDRASEYDDDEFFKCSIEQQRDLEERVKRACDEWQEAHGLVFKCRSFSATRNAEYIVVPHPDAALNAETSND